MPGAAASGPGREETTPEAGRGPTVAITVGGGTAAATVGRSGCVLQSNQRSMPESGRASAGMEGSSNEKKSGRGPTGCDAWTFWVFLNTALLLGTVQEGRGIPFMPL